MIKSVDQHITSPTNSGDGSRNLREPLNKSNLGLKNLKQTQDYIDHIKRRLSLLQIQQEKNKHKVRENYRKLKFLSKVQDQTAKDQMRKMKHQQKVREQREISRINNNLQRQKQRENIKSMRDGALQRNRKAYSQIRQDRQANQLNINKMKKKDKDNNTQKRIKIIQMEKKKRQHIQKYLNKRKNDFEKSSQLQGYNFESRRTERLHLLDELTNLQMQMIKKNSLSKEALVESSELLRALKAKGRVKSGKSSEQKLKIAKDDPEKLPTLNGHETKKNLDFVVL